MNKFIIIQVSQDGGRVLPSSNELLRIYHLLDDKGRVNVLAAAYNERIRLNNQSHNTPDEV